MWKIIALIRIKHLTWRICSDRLPSKLHLTHHHVPCSPLCQHCGNNYEDDWHALFGCMKTHSYWQVAGLLDVISPCLQTFHDTKSLILDVYVNEDRKIVVELQLCWKDCGRMRMILFNIMRRKKHLS